MKVIIIPTIMLPMPPVKGGAVQNLIKLYLNWNEDMHQDDIFIFSFYDEDAKEAAQKYKHTTFIYVNDLPPVKLLQDKSIKGLSGIAYRTRQFLYQKQIVNEIVNNKNLSDFQILLLENCPQLAPGFRRALGDSITIYTHLHNDYVNDTTIHVQEIANSVDKFICVSDYISDRVRTVVANKPVVTVRNGVELKKSVSDTNEQLMNKYNIKKDDFVIIFTGRMVKEKGPHVLLEAYSKMKNKERTKILFLGSKLYGQNITDDYSKQLILLAEPYKKNIIFTGFIPYNEISNFYNIADIGVLPSLWDDPCPLTVIEYLVFGLPIIATISGGIPEIVSDSSALLYERDDKLSQNIASAIDNLIENPSKMKSMSESAVKRAKYFSAEAYIDRIFNSLHNGEDNHEK